MRRSDRQINELSEIVRIIESCDVCRIALTEGNLPYIVPMNFGYEVDNKDIILYLHCANEGRKLEILKKNNHVCFEMDLRHELVTGPTACSHSMNYESLIGNAIAEIVTDNENKIHALNLIMKKYTHKGDYTFEENQLNNVTVIKLVSSDYTAKRRV